MDNYNYPMGSDTSDAPWNQEDIPEKEIEVLVSVTLSKSVKVRVNDYKVNCGQDDEGHYFEDVDYSECNLHDAVMKQVILPQDAYMFTKTNTSAGSRAFKDLIDWHVDEIECILDK